VFNLEVTDAHTFVSSSHSVLSHNNSAGAESVYQRVATWSPSARAFAEVLEQKGTPIQRGEFGFNAEKVLYRAVRVPSGGDSPVGELDLFEDILGPTAFSSAEDAVRHVLVPAKSKDWYSEQNDIVLTRFRVDRASVNQTPTFDGQLNLRT